MKNSVIINKKASVNLPRQGRAHPHKNRRHFAGVKLEESKLIESDIIADIEKGIEHFWSQPHRKSARLRLGI